MTISTSTYARVRFLLFWALAFMLAVYAVASARAGLISAVGVESNIPSAAGRDLINTINGSGLTSLSLTADHALQSASNAWRSASGVTTGNVDFDLGGEHVIFGFSFWNYNGSGCDEGIGGLQVLSSTDGVNFVAIPGAPSSIPYSCPNVSPAQSFSFAPMTATHIRFRILSNFGDPRVSFCEVQFDGIGPAGAGHLAAGNGSAQVFDGGPGESASDETTGPSDEGMDFNASDSSRTDSLGTHASAHGWSQFDQDDREWGGRTDVEVALQVFTKNSFPDGGDRYGAMAQGSLSSVIQFVMPLDNVEWAYELEGFTVAAGPSDVSGITRVVVKNLTESEQLLILTEPMQTGVQTVLSANTGDLIGITTEMSGEVGVAPDDPTAVAEYESVLKMRFDYVSFLVVPTDVITIQLALDTISGDPTSIIEVLPGTYNESINFNGKAVTLRSASGDLTDTIIDGGASGSVVTCASGEGPDTVLQGFTITNGSATSGGGMFISGSSPTVTDCRFSENAADFGGGMNIQLGGDPMVKGCVFSENGAARGGGAYVNTASGTFTNCRFSDNTSTSPGGGGVSLRGSSAVIDGCVFRRNDGLQGGGILNAGGSDALVSNSVFTGNTATWGGGLWSHDSVATVLNCSFTLNSAPSGGGGVLNHELSAVDYSNCIIWGNSPTQTTKFGTGDPEFSHCDIEGSGGTTAWVAGLGTDLGGNIDADPLFVDADGLDNTPGTADDDLRLSGCSPAIDVGDNDSILGETTDLQEDPRFVDDTGVVDNGNGTSPIVDMGAFERQFSSPGPIIKNVTQDTLHCSIQAAIDVADGGARGVGDDIVVPPGTYYEAINFLGKAITLRSASGDPADTIIDATSVPDLGNGVPVVRFVSGETAATALDGFTITGGTGDTATFGVPVGGGMFNIGSSPTVTNCAFSVNEADFGGGMFNDDSSSPTVTNCAFSVNEADSGGGIYNFHNSSAIVTDCVFNGNTATNGGGAAFVNGGNLTMTNCLIEDNVSQDFCPGVFYLGGSGSLTNCLFLGNTAARAGALGSQAGATIDVTNCTIANNNNTLGGEAAGLTLFDSTVNVDNTIIYGNVAGGSEDQSAQISQVGTTPTLTLNYSLVQGLTGSLGGEGNVDGDPLFADADGGDLRLLSESPCIDAGDNTEVPAGIETDLDGHERFFDDPDMLDTGNPDGVNPVVDIGAYEVIVFSLGDLTSFTDCMNGPGVPPSPTPPTTSQECLDAFDFDNDSDVDLEDSSTVQGSNRSSE